MRIKKNDNVKVIVGKDKGKVGRVISVFSRKNKVLVEGVQFVKKHKKIEKGDKGAKKGGIETMESPIHVSNVMLVEKDTGQITRTGRKKDSETKKNIRFSKKTGKTV
jgi:large subunit ribosomal protein L24